MRSVSKTMKDLVNRSFVKKTTLVINFTSIALENLPFLINFQETVKFKNIIFNQVDFNQIPDTFWLPFYDSVTELGITECCFVDDSDLFQILSEMHELKSLELTINCGNSFYNLIPKLGPKCKCLTLLMKCNQTNHSNAIEINYEKFVPHIETLRIYPEVYCSLLPNNVKFFKILELSLKYIYFDVVFRNKNNRSFDMELSWFNNFNFNLRSMGITIDSEIEEQMLINFSEKMIDLEEINILWWGTARLDRKMKILSDNMIKMKKMSVYSNESMNFEIVNLTGLRNIQVGRK